jgi:hypothetical protein
VKTALYHGPPLPVRSHPWTTAVDNEASRYYDFKAAPWLIRDCIEDLLPWQSHAATESMYRLVEWLNGAGGILETNDFQFSGPVSMASENAAVDGDRAMQGQGRLMILFRQLSLNTSQPHMEAFGGRLHQILNQHDQSFELGLIATSCVPVRFIHALPVWTGEQLMVSFWAWGATEEATMHNLHRLMCNLQHAFRLLVSGDFAD